MTFEATRKGRVAVIWSTEGTPAVFRGALRQGLQTTLAAALDDRSLGALVLRLGPAPEGISRTPPRVLPVDPPLDDDPPSLAEVCALIESAEIPIVAALHQTVADAAADLALAAQVRIFARSACLGFPAARRGLLPFGGAPVRLAEIVGLDTARQMSACGTLVSAQRAQALGLADGVAKGPADAAAEQLARRLAALGSHRRPRKPVAPSTAQRAKRPAPPDAPVFAAALDAVLAAACQDPSAARRLAVSQAYALAAGPEANRLAQLAAAEASTRPAAARPAPVERIAMSGISRATPEAASLAAEALLAGFDVLLVESDLAAPAARDAIAPWLPASEARHVLSRLQAIPRLAPWHGADFALRAGQVPAYAPAGVVDVVCREEGASGSEPLSLVVPLRPKPETGVLQICAAPDVPGPTLAALALFADRTKRQPLHVASTTPDLTGALYAAWRGALDRLLEDGATPAQVDRAVEMAGFALGPYARADLRGLAVEGRARRNAASQRDPRLRHPTLVDRLIDAGRTGRDAGAGFFLWTANGPVQTDDAPLLREARAARRTAGVTARTIEDRKILDRGLLAIGLAAQRLVESGQALRAAVTVAATAGLGMPRHLGGPLAWLDALGTAEVAARRRHLAVVDDPVFWSDAAAPHIGAPHRRRTHR